MLLVLATIDVARVEVVPIIGFGCVNCSLCPWLGNLRCRRSPYECHDGVEDALDTKPGHVGELPADGLHACPNSPMAQDE